jgi:hypothetical protein
MSLAPKDAWPILEAMMKTTEFKPTLMDHVYDEGIDRGKAEFLLKALEARGLQPSDAQREQVESCTDEEQLNRWFGRALTATSVEEVFAD